MNIFTFFPLLAGEAVGALLSASVELTETSGTGPILYVPAGCPPKATAYLIHILKEDVHRVQDEFQREWGPLGMKSDKARAAWDRKRQAAGAVYRQHLMRAFPNEMTHFPDHSFDAILKSWLPLPLIP